MPELQKGLEGVVAAQSSIGWVDGPAGVLRYRGYNIHELAERSTFEEICWLLWHGELPERAELEATRREIATQRTLPDGVVQVLRLLPRDTHPMSALRTGVSALGAYDPEAELMTPEANRRKAARLVGQTTSLVAAIDRVRRGLDVVPPNPELDTASDFLRMLSGRTPDPANARVFDVCLVLHAEHELNASTFAARVTCATLADIHGAVTAGVATLKGPLHGGANEAVAAMLSEIGGVSRVEPWLDRALGEKRRIMGFGHRVYRTIDPRATHLKRLSRGLAERTDNLPLFEMSDRLERLVKEKKGLNPNVDFYSASTYQMLGISTDLFTPIFAMSRMSGWTAHVLEQYADNRLIRPRADYTGYDERPYVPLEKR